jgi:hypothetical protein
MTQAGRAVVSARRDGGVRAEGMGGMTKRYDEDIDVTPDPSSPGTPLSFVWRGRRYDIDQPLMSWREGSEWWLRGDHNAAGRQDREFHRVLARPAQSLATGEVDADGFLISYGAVYDVFRDRISGGWRMARVWD